MSEQDSKQVRGFILAVEDVAEALRVSCKTARRLMRDGEVGAAFKKGKRLYVLRRDFEKALERMARMNGVGI